MIVIASFLRASLPTAWADPVGEQVVSGDVTFTRSDGITVINASNNSIINYTGFDILPHETVQFVQPNSTSRVLNRVNSVDPSRIDGALIANGIVYIVNPAGVYFGNGALVNVGGIYAAAGTITNQNFLASANQFTDLTGDVTNYGSINANIVSLIGRQVGNYGSIVAPGGLVTMAAGKNVFIGEASSRYFVMIDGGNAAPAAGTGVTNAGSVSAPGGEVIMGAGDLYSMGLWNTGTVAANDIRLEGGKGTTHVSGTLDAGNAAGNGGNVTITGENVALTGATINASGSTGGGTVLVGSTNPAHAGENSQAVFIGSDSAISANALASGDGGTIIVWGDLVAKIFGQLSARGGALAGNGGFVETSAASLDVLTTPNLAAPNGRGGLWLLDPSNVTIQDSAPGSLDGLRPDFTADADGATVSDDIIEAALDAGTSVLISTDRLAGTETGTITQNVSIDKTAGGDATLAYTAADSIVLNAGITNTSPGKLNVEMVAGDPAQVGGPTQAVIIGAGITTNDGNFTSSSASFATGAAIDAGAGSVSITADIVDVQATITGNAGIALQPLTAGQTIGINDAAGDFNLTLGEIGALSTTGTLTIGAADSGTIHVGSLGVVDGSLATFDVTIQGGGVTFTNGVILPDDKTLTINSTGGIQGSNSGTDVTIGGTAGTLVIANAGGNVDIETAIDRLGGATITGSLALANSGTSLTVTGAVATNGDGGRDITLDVGTGAFTNTAAIDAGTGNVSITADTIAVQDTITANGLTGITLKPSTATQSIGINDAAGLFNLTQAELDFLSSATMVTVGALGNTGAVDVGSLGAIDISTETYKLDILGGSTSINGDFTSDNDITFNAGTGSFTNAVGTTIAAGAGAFTATADTVDLLGTISATIRIMLQPYTLSTSIGVNDALGTFNLSLAELNLLASPGWVLIGADGGTGVTTVGSLGAVDVSTESYSLYFRAGSFTNTTAVTVASGREITVQTDDIDIQAALNGPGGITLQPATFSRSVGINDAGLFNVSLAELGNLTSTGLVTIGRFGGTGAVSLGAVDLAAMGKTFDILVRGGSFTNSGVLTGAPGRNVSIQADTINIQTNINSSNNITLMTQTAGQSIGIVDPAGDFNLTQAELDLLTAPGTLTVGALDAQTPRSLRSGAITIGGTAPVDLSGKDFNLTLYGGATTFTNGITLNSNKLFTFNVSGGIDGSNAAVDLISAGTTASLFIQYAGGNVDLDTQIDRLTGATVNGTLKIENDTSIDVTGAVTTASANGNITLDANTGTLTNTATIDAANGAVTLIANSMDLQAAITGNNAVNLQPYSADRTIAINDATGDLSLLLAELLLINSTGTLTIGHPTGAGQWSIGSLGVVDLSPTTYDLSLLRGPFDIMNGIITNGHHIAAHGNATILEGRSVTISTGTAAGTITIDGTINGTPGGATESLTLTTGNGITLGAAVGNTTPFAVLDLNAAQNAAITHINANITAADVQVDGLHGEVRIDGDSLITATDNPIDFLNTTAINGAADGAQSLSINTGNALVRLNAVGSTTALGSLQITTSGTISLGGDIITDNNAGAGKSGSITIIGGTTILAGDRTINSNKDGDATGGAVNLASTTVRGTADGAQGLAITAGNGAVSLGPVGAGAALGQLDVTTTGTTTLAGDITTDNSAGKSGNVTITGGGITNIAGDITIDTDKDDSATGGSVNFAATALNAATDGAQTLTITAGNGAVSFGTAGTTRALGALHVTTAGTTTLNGNVSTDNNAGKTGDVLIDGGGITTIASDITINTNKNGGATGGDVNLASTNVNGAAAGSQTLAIVAADGAVDLSQMGALTALGGLTVTTSGTTTLAGNIYTDNITKSGAVTINGSGTTVLTSNVTINTNSGASATGGPVNLAATTINGGTNQFIINPTSGAVNLGPAAALSLLDVNTSGTVTFNGNITAADIQMDGLTGAVVIGANSTLQSTNNAIDFHNSTGINGTAAGAQSFAINAGSAAISLPAVGATTPLASLHTTTSGTLTLNGNVRTDRMGAGTGDILMDGNGFIALAQNITITSDANADNTGGNITLAAQRVTGSRDLTINAASGKVTMANAGTVATPLTNLTIAGSSIEFSGSDVYLYVTSGDIDLNTLHSGDATPPNRATIYNNDGGLYCISQNFTMHQNDKLTATGNIGITASVAATLGDLTALNDIHVAAGTIGLVQRDAGSVLLPGSRSREDRGVDFVAGGSIIFTPQTAPGLFVVGPGTPLFATSSGEGSVGGYIFRKYGPITVADLVGAGITYDLSALCPGNADLANSLAGAFAAISNEPVRPPLPSPDLLKALADLGIFIREVSTDEVLAGLLHNGTFDDELYWAYIGDGRFSSALAEPEAYKVAVARLTSARMAEAVFAQYRSILKKDDIDQRSAIRDSLQTSLDEYRRSSGPDKFDPRGFADFLRATESAQSLSYMTGLNELLFTVERLGLSETEFRKAEQVMLGTVIDLKYNGKPLTVDEFEAAVQAAGELGEEPETFSSEEAF